MINKKITIGGLVIIALLWLGIIGQAAGQEADIYLPAIFKDGSRWITPTLAPTMDPWPTITYPPPGTPGYCLSIGPVPTPTPTGPLCFIGTVEPDLRDQP